MPFSNITLSTDEIERLHRIVQFIEGRSLARFEEFEARMIASNLTAREYALLLYMMKMQTEHRFMQFVPEREAEGTTPPSTPSEYIQQCLARYGITTR